MQKVDLSFFSSSGYKWIFSVSLSAFFYLFVIFFLPFGVDNYNPDHEYTFDFFKEIFYFLAATFPILLVNEFLLKNILIRNISTRNIFLWHGWTFILISTVIFYTYNILGNWHDYHLKSYFGFIVNCSSVLVFPSIAVFYYFRHRALRFHIDNILTTRATSVDESHLITFEGQGSKDRISLSLSTFLYGQAQDNYVALFYLENQTIQKFLIRASLGKLVESLQHPAIMRSHRSYMVNLNQVVAVKGGSSDLSLTIDSIEESIPVSKSYLEAVLKQLRTLKEFS